MEGGLQGFFFLYFLSHFVDPFFYFYIYSFSKIPLAVVALGLFTYI